LRQTWFAKQTQVRIRRPKIGELAHQAQGARIFAVGEYLVALTDLSFANAHFL
jgi:hypothetical protein